MKKRGVGNKGQTWSVDLIVGIVVFLLIVILLFAIIAPANTRSKQLKADNENVLSKIQSENVINTGLPPIVDGDKLNETALEELYTLDYDEVKAKLGINQDVCIVVIDDTGGIISPNGAGDFSFGNTGDLINISGSKICGN